MADVERSTLPDYIRRRMNELGIEHQADLARRAGISKGGLSHILTGNGVLSKPETIERLARALQVEPAELTSRMGYEVDSIGAPDARAMRLARAIVDRPWMAARENLLLSLSQSEFDELMDLAEFRKGREQNRKGRQGPDSR